MKIIDTSTLTPDTFLTTDHAEWIYCGLDSMVTAEIFPKMEKLHNENTLWVERFEMATQVPAIAMMLEGVEIDEWERAQQEQRLAKDSERLWKHLQYMADAVWGRPLNPRSATQMQEFFYKAMQLPPIYRRRPSGEKTLTTDREALEKLSQYFLALPIIETILSIKQMDGLLKVLRSGIDADGRMRTSFGVASTVTGRWSSRKNAFATGTNFQNITPEVRSIFIAGEGHLLAYADLEQAESRAVAYISEDLEYIRACESSDLHTLVACLVWPELAWTEDESLNKSTVAAQQFYRHFTYRDMAKRGGHGTNYYGTPYTMARHLRVIPKIMETFQARYFSAFPGIPRWHQRVAERIQTTNKIVTPLMRERVFFDRTDRDETLRSAIAHEPQSLVGDILNAGLLRVWRYFHFDQKRDIRVYPLVQVHDAVLYRIPDDRDALPHLDHLLKNLHQIPVEVNGKTMLIPVEVKYGRNWKDLALPGPKLDKLLTAPVRTFAEHFLASSPE